jgi:hypothetical protein
MIMIFLSLLKIKNPLLRVGWFVNPVFLPTPLYGSEVKLQNRYQNVLVLADSIETEIINDRRGAVQLGLKRNPGCDVYYHKR